MKSVVIGAHLHRTDVEPIAEAMKIGDLFASVFAIQDDRPLGDRDLLLEIAAVRSQLLDRATFIAIRYGFTVRDENELAAKCLALTGRWRELLITHRDEVEMTLKAAAAGPATRPDRRDFAAGADYLRALHESMRALNIDPEFRSGLERTLIPLGTEHRWLRESASVELALLVRRRDLDKVRVAGEALQRDFPRVPFLLSGPWPLEVFTDDHQQ
jgi:gas vesicle protein GvpL/GvpF